MRKIKKIWLFVFIFLILLILIYFLTKLNSPTLDQKMEKLVSEYYEEKIKGKVFGIDKQIITLKSLEQAKYDIKSFKNCDPESFAYVIVENSEETNVDKIKYTVETHLKCD